MFCWCVECIAELKGGIADRAFQASGIPEGEWPELKIFRLGSSTQEDDVNKSASY